MAKRKRNRDWIQDYFFLFIPSPLPDELLSSWLTRMALEHKRTLSLFFSLFIRHDGNSSTRTDLDFLFDEKLFKTLSQKSTLDIKEIYRMSLRSEEGQLFTCNDSLYPPLQIRKLTDKRNHNGLMYCPKCLKEDKIPYFRKKWRYDFYNACPKHRILLIDRCWRCYSKIEFSKIKHQKELCICYKCEKDLRENITTAISSNYSYGLKAVKWFEKGLSRGYFLINKQKVKSVFVFDSFTKLRYLLHRKEKLNLNEFPMIDEYKDICKKLNEYNSKKALSIKKEFILTSMVYFLFQAYPKNFINFAYENNLTYRDFVHDFKNMPFWYKKMVDDLIPMQNKVGREISESEIVAAIKYLKIQNKIVNQLEVSKVVGCHFTIHKQFVKKYKKLNKSR
ncbi:TniQ family protein [Halarcobacter sp.]|uniref:TniQ family protein n=1 Tax=Halarcobacter sp. TaxID=2321133 RepID=UPI003B000870